MPSPPKTNILQSSLEPAISLTMNEAVESRTFEPFNRSNPGKHGSNNGWREPFFPQIFLKFSTKIGEVVM